MGLQLSKLEELGGLQYRAVGAPAESLLLIHILSLTFFSPLCVTTIEQQGTSNLPTKLFLMVLISRDICCLNCGFFINSQIPISKNN